MNRAICSRFPCASAARPLPGLSAPTARPQTDRCEAHREPRHIAHLKGLQRTATVACERHSALPVGSPKRGTRERLSFPGAMHDREDQDLLALLIHPINDDVRTLYKFQRVLNEPRRPMRSSPGVLNCSKRARKRRIVWTAAVGLSLAIQAYISSRSSAALARMMTLIFQDDAGGHPAAQA